MRRSGTRCRGDRRGRCAWGASWGLGILSSKTEGQTMGFLSRKTEMPTLATALPGRSQPMPVKFEHYVLGHPIAPPFPDGLELALFGMGCSWGAEKKSWPGPGVYPLARGSG